MKKTLAAITALIVLSSLPAACAAEGKSRKTVKPVAVTSLEQAKALAPGTTSVYVEYTYQLHKADRFTGIMKTLARNPGIRHLRLRIPNSLHAKSEALEVLREFQSLERLELFDDREFQAAAIFEQVAAMKSLKQVKFSFR
ncbi:MAG: hypothetical protein IID44_12280 [Planctomycetes bacterium]|nr:hypothetical protein [Planctomycetota bacterium]